MTMRQTPFHCSDGMCGADDCARCCPDYFGEKDEDEDDSGLDDQPDVKF